MEQPPKVLVQELRISRYNGQIRFKTGVPGWTAQDIAVGAVVLLGLEGLPMWFACRVTESRRDKKTGCCLFTGEFA